MAALPFSRSIGVSHFWICLACPSKRRSIASVPDKARAMSDRDSKARLALPAARRLPQFAAARWLADLCLDPEAALENRHTGGPVGAHIVGHVVKPRLASSATTASAVISSRFDCASRRVANTARLAAQA